MSLSEISREYGSDLALASVIAKAKKEAVEEFKAKLRADENLASAAQQLEVIAEEAEERGTLRRSVLDDLHRILHAAIEEASK